MSIQAMSWAYDQRVGDSADKAVLLSISNHAGRDGTNAYPGQAAICEETELPRRTVERSIASLLQNGWIIETRKPAPGRPRQFAVRMTAATVAGVEDRLPPNPRQTPAKPQPVTSEDTDRTFNQEPTFTPNGVKALPEPEEVDLAKVVADAYYDERKERLGVGARDWVILNAAAKRFIKQGIPLDRLLESAHACATDPWGARAFDRHLAILSGARTNLASSKSERNREAIDSAISKMEAMGL